MNEIHRRSIMLMALWVFFYALSQTKIPESPKAKAEEDPLKSLVEIIIDNDSLDFDEPEVPELLAEIINDYYAEDLVSNSTTTGVLDYLQGVYKEHGYHDTGNWARGTSRRRYSYVPYEGVLPEYELSDFRLPVGGSLTSGYGYRPRFRRFHHGIDMALNAGDTVRAALPGVVVKTGYDTGGYGRYVVITHAGGMETLYGHLNTSLVRPGEKIEIGQPIGFGGSTGNSTGPHLHFETRYRGVAIDPVPWFNIRF